MTDTLALWIWLAGVAVAGGIAFLVSARKTRIYRSGMLVAQFKDEKRKLDH